MKAMKIIEGKYVVRSIRDKNCYSSNDEIKFKSLKTKNPVTRNSYRHILENRVISAIRRQPFFKAH